MTGVLWCWCCATWGLWVAAVDGQKSLCRRCLNSSPSACAARHKAEALAAGQRAAAVTT